MTKQVVKMRRSEVLEMEVELNRAGSLRCDREFAYWISKNKRVLEAEARIARENLEPLEKERMKLIEEKYGQKDKEGKLIREEIGPNQMRYLLNDPEAFEKEYAPIREKTDAYLKAEVELEMFPIRWEYFPGAIDPSLMYWLEPLIDDYREPLRDPEKKVDGKKPVK